MIRRGPRPADRFAMIANAALEDESLTWRARGVLAYLLSRPEGWSTSAERLAGQSPKGKEGRDSMRAVLKELEDAGYLVREKVQDERGRWSTGMVVYDFPAKTSAEPPIVDSTITPEPPTLVDSKNGGSPGVGEPAVGQPAVGKPGPFNKKETKTENKKDSSSPPTSPSPGETDYEKLSRWPGHEFLAEAGRRWSWLTVESAAAITKSYFEDVKAKGWQFSPEGWLKFIEQEDLERSRRAKTRAYAPNGVPL